MADMPLTFRAILFSLVVANLIAAYLVDLACKGLYTAGKNMIQRCGAWRMCVRRQVMRSLHDHDASILMMQKAKGDKRFCSAWEQGFSMDTV